LQALVIFSFLLLAAPDRVWRKVCATFRTGSPEALVTDAQPAVQISSEQAPKLGQRYSRDSNSVASSSPICKVCREPRGAYSLNIRWQIPSEIKHDAEIFLSSDPLWREDCISSIRISWRAVAKIRVARTKYLYGAGRDRENTETRKRRTT
jgi:hypothetical protein